MSADSEFYAACMGNTDFASGINSLAHEYKADAVAPFANYQTISAVGTDDLDGTADEGERRYQLSVWASSPTTAKQLAEYAIAGVRADLDCSNVFQRSLGRDPDEELFGYGVDFLIWFQTP